jgi:hypothetical protein
VRALGTDRPPIVMIDGDTVFEPTTVGRLVALFADPTVGAVAGNAEVASRRGLLARWQHIEYVMGFHVDRGVYDVRCVPIVPGAAGAFRRQVLPQVGGVSDDTLVEDTPMTMAIRRTGWRVVYEDSARACTEAPATLGQLWRQRNRWSYGTMQSMWKHRHAVVESGASGPGLGGWGWRTSRCSRCCCRCSPRWWTSSWSAGLLRPGDDAGAVVRGPGGADGRAVIAFRLEREPVGVLVLLPLQQIVYRQLMYALLIRSMVTAMGGIRLGWQKLRRVGGLEVHLHGSLESAMSAPAPRPERRLVGLSRR